MAKDKDDVEVIPPSPKSGSDRTRAARLRARVRVRAPLAPEDAEWLNEYEARTKDVGASASHKVSYTEESTQAMGTGSAAEVAAAAAMVREDGRRLDNILDRSIRFMESACLRYEKLVDILLAHRHEDSEQIRALLNAHHDNTLDRIELEGALLKAQNADGEDDKAMAMQLLTQALGGRLGKKVKGVPSE